MVLTFPLIAVFSFFLKEEVEISIWGWDLSFEAWARNQAFKEKSSFGPGSALDSLSDPARLLLLVELKWGSLGWTISGSCYKQLMSRTTNQKVAIIEISFLTEFAGLGCGFEPRGLSADRSTIWSRGEKKEQAHPAFAKFQLELDYDR